MTGYGLGDGWNWVNCFNDDDGDDDDDVLTVNAAGKGEERVLGESWMAKEKRSTEKL